MREDLRPASGRREEPGRGRSQLAGLHRAARVIRRFARAGLLAAALFFVAHGTTRADPLEAPPGTWLRRAALDLTGRLPSAAQLALVERDPGPTTRRVLVSELTGSPLFARRWGKLLAAPLISPDRELSSLARRVEEFVAGSLLRGQSWNATVRELLTAEGSVDETPATAFLLQFIEARSDVASRIGSGLMGVRLACAQCHDHPFARWTVADFHGLAAWFARTRRMDLPADLYRIYREGRRADLTQVDIVLPAGAQDQLTRQRLERLGKNLAVLNRHTIGGPPRTPESRAVEMELFRNAGRTSVTTGAATARLTDLTRTVPVLIEEGTAELPPPDLPELPQTLTVTLPAPSNAPAVPATQPAQSSGPTVSTTQPAQSSGPTVSTIPPAPGPSPAAPLAQPAAGRLPRTSRAVPPRLPGTPASPPPGRTRRETLAAWLTHPANPYLAAALVHRVHGHLFGHALEAPDESRPAIGAADAEAFAREGHDVAALIRRLVLSPAYRAAAFPLRPLDAGQIAGALASGLGLADSTALERALARQARARADDATPEAENPAPLDLPAALTWVASPEIDSALARSTLVSELGHARGADRLERLFAALLSRAPTAAERTRFERAPLADSAWSIIASAEFLTQH